MLSPTKYITSQLSSITRQPALEIDNHQTAEAIVKRILSKKFRKYSVDQEFTQHIETVVNNAISLNQPIPFVWVFGGYKLFSLPTSPEVDWAELFSMIYFAKWLAPICKVYKPGVVFDFFSDDVIVPQMNNIDKKDIEKYISSFQSLLEFIKSYLPKNYKMTLTRVKDQYSSNNEFQLELKQNKKNLAKELPNGLPELNEAKIAMIKLNVKPTPTQIKDHHWKEKVQLIHDAYSKSSKRRPYYRNKNKIMVINTPISGALAIGTTKNSVAKFWVGVGVLEKRSDRLIEKILSPKQIKTAKLEQLSISIPKLSSKNFKTIGYLSI